MDLLAKNYLSRGDEQSAVQLLSCASCEEHHSLGVMVGKFLFERHKNSAAILEEYALNLYFAGNKIDAYMIFDKILQSRGVEKSTVDRILFNQHFCINAVQHLHTFYNPKIVSELNSQLLKKNSLPMVTFTITTCKRFDLFVRTIDSFLNCCLDLDLIHKWVCVDDNSSEEDRKKMAERYPFFDFYWKSPEEKGHPQSMNIIRNMVTTPYYFHMEDDWQFFSKRHFIRDALEVFGNDSSLKQCLVNKNYAEVESDIDIVGSVPKTTEMGLRYYVHHWVDERNAEHLEDWCSRYGLGGKHCRYWPHFSFRPSLVQTHVLHDLGNFDVKVNHFEIEYAYRYKARGWQ